MTTRNANRKETDILKVKRVYEPPSAADGYRVLVDRLWPRGLKRDASRIDLWLEDIAPSTELRRWFGHDPARWDAFVKRYREELAANEPVLQDLARRAREDRLTLLYAAKDEQRNNAVVLESVLVEKRRPGESP